MSYNLHNRKILKEKRVELRNNATPAESVLWLRLKNRQICGSKFRRQHSILHFILDFYSPANKLAIELDGHGHMTQGGQAYDEARDNDLKKLGIRILRFENKEIFNDIDGVLEKIRVMICGE